MTFAAALKAFLRQDPDIVMVGEIRDLETAEIAVKAAQELNLLKYAKKPPRYFQAAKKPLPHLTYQYSVAN
ncbi:hypothetical protein TI05_19610 [Achromatium sp. WMS3]|nr:hypothetical protein TI05_19610 [Achromatium sp. WMS3]